MKLNVEFTSTSIPGVVAEAAIVFDNADVLTGCKLVGFTIRERNGKLFCTGPARAYGTTAERQYFAFLRAADGHTPAYKVFDYILDAWRARSPKASAKPDKEAR